MEAFFKTSSEGLHSSDQDLLLAAEIGKTLLEKNRELEALLKSTQDFAEEKAAQAEFYSRQVDILRESNESCAHECEILEGTNQAIHDQYDQLNADYKILQGKNSRLWELINNLEKKNEDLCAEVKLLQNEIQEYESLETEENHDESILTTNGHQNGTEEAVNKSEVSTEQNDISDAHVDGQISNLEAEIENVRNELTELRVYVKVEKWQKEEVDSQMQDVIHENQLLHQKVAELNKEILEWESFAQKEECYRRIAEAFTIKHNIEVEEPFVSYAHINGLSPSILSKAKSCEYLNRVPDRECTQNIIKGSCVKKLVFSCDGHSNSILSELDKEYDDLVKRYEALLEKCKQEGKFNENPERTKKVQRAIQTLSLDFSKLTTPIQSPVKPTKTPTGVEKCGVSSETQCYGEDDYRLLFSQIFAKLKEVPSRDGAG